MAESSLQGSLSWRERVLSIMTLQNLKLFSTYYIFFSVLHSYVEPMRVLTIFIINRYLCSPYLCILCHFKFCISGDFSWVTPVPGFQLKCPLAKLINLPPFLLVNTLRLRQTGSRFSHDIFKRIFLNEKVWILIKISLKVIPKGPVNYIPALVQIMAWCLLGDKPLSEPMMISLLTYMHQLASMS